MGDVCAAEERRAHGQSRCECRKAFWALLFRWLTAEADFPVRQFDFLYTWSK